jgi:hypothetical protein
MFIHKIFHLRQPVAEARERVRELGTFSGSEKEFAVHCERIGPEGIGRLEVESGEGERVSADIEEVPGDDPNRILFRSVEGTVELAGMIELYPIRPNLTEAVLTVEYEALSPLQKAIDAMSMALDRLLNRQLVRVEACGSHAGSPRVARC